MTTATSPAPGTAGFARVLRGDRYRRLLAVRLTSQLGDGAFQAGLASFVLFNPTQAPTAPLVAGVLTVAVLPFTVVGPFAGVLLDRWSRQRVLLVSNLVRVVLALAVAALVVAADGRLEGGVLGALYLLVLAALSVNRFLLAGLGASLPHVVPRALLVPANAVTPTLGTGAFGAGFGLGLGLRLALGPGAPTDGLVVAAAAALFLGAALLTGRLGHRELGPDTPSAASTRAAAVAVARGLREGAAHVWRRPVARDAIGAVGAHRFAFGLSTIATVLLARGHLSDDVEAGFGVLGLVGGAAAAGALLAAAVTPAAVRALERRGTPLGLGPLDTWLVLALLVAAVTEALFVLGIATAPLAAGALVLGLAGQVVKIGADTHVQTAVAEHVRGRAFAFYDVVFNAAFVLAAGLGALVVPDDGYSRPLYAGIAVLYLAVAVGYARAAARPQRG
ncbi:MFS transporter [Aquipuribacter nitratireducens]|uniref:MFS transporter n=1 Tax=Aquipuribacter nitratireducens TaxID=650104 RepID=A0ABW0GMU5_9MICO